MIAWFFSSLFPLLMQQGANPSSTTCQASIRCRQVQDSQLEIQAQCQSASPLHVRYELLLEKHGPSGSTRNRQSGWSTLVANETKTLSSMRFNTQPPDAYKINLRLFDEQGQLLGQDSLTHQTLKTR